MKLTRQISVLAGIVLANGRVGGSSSSSIDLVDNQDHNDLVDGSIDASYTVIEDDARQRRRDKNTKRISSNKDRIRKSEKDANKAFYDLRTFSDDEKRMYIDDARKMSKVGNDIDWDMQRDRYLIASFSNDISNDNDDDDDDDMKNDDKDIVEATNKEQQQQRTLIQEGTERKLQNSRHPRPRQRQRRKPGNKPEVVSFDTITDGSVASDQQQDNAPHTAPYYSAPYSAPYGAPFAAPHHKYDDIEDTTAPTNKNNNKPYYKGRTAGKKKMMGGNNGGSGKKNKNGNGKKMMMMNNNNKKHPKAPTPKDVNEPTFEPTFEPTCEPTDSYGDGKKDKNIYHTDDEPTYEPTTSPDDIDDDNGDNNKAGNNNGGGVIIISGNNKDGNGDSSDDNNDGGGNDGDNNNNNNEDNSSGSGDDTSSTTRDEDDDIAVRIPDYEYDKGNCGEDGNGGNSDLPCAPDNLSEICDKYNGQGSFRACLDACRPSFCCIHDAPPETNFESPNCNEDINCAQYACCYIVWWKLHDTIGPATMLQLEQNEDFFDIDAEEIQSDVTNDEFYRKMLFHHFDDSEEIIRRGTVRINETLSVFNSDLIFLDPQFWDTDI